jgi:hypothetical protein
MKPNSSGKATSKVESADGRVGAFEERKRRFMILLNVET